MFSKLLLTTAAISSSQAIRLGFLGDKADTAMCSYNVDRMMSGNNDDDFNEYSGGSDLYVDATFPADQSSLFWMQFRRDNEIPQLYLNEVKGWARPSAMEKGDHDPILWGNKGILPNGINQLRLGDCWFLASAAAIAEYPERIKKIFTNTEYDSAGIF